MTTITDVPLTHAVLGRLAPAPRVAAPRPGSLLMAFVTAHPVLEAAIQAAFPAAASVVHVGQAIRVVNDAGELEHARVDAWIVSAKALGDGTKVEANAVLRGLGGQVLATLSAQALLAGVSPADRVPAPSSPLPGGEAGLPGASAAAQPTAVTGSATSDPAWEPLTEEITVDGAFVDEYARLSRDLNPLHLDDQAARAAGFTGRIAHGMSVLGLAIEAAERWASEHSGFPRAARAVSTRFSASVGVGEDLIVGASAAPDGTIALSARGAGGPALKGARLELGEGESS